MSGNIGSTVATGATVTEVTQIVQTIYVPASVNLYMALPAGSSAGTITFTTGTFFSVTQLAAF